MKVQKDNPYSLQHKKLSTITTENIKTLHSIIRSKSPAVANKVIKFLNVVFVYGIEVGELEKNPVKPSLRCEENPSRTRRLDIGEYEKLMTVCKKSRTFWCPIIDFAIHSAMRRGELLRLTWQMVHLDKKYITLPP